MLPTTHMFSNDAVWEFQIQREALNQLICDVIVNAQQKYKQYTDKKRQKMQLQVRYLYGILKVAVL